MRTYSACLKPVPDRGEPPTAFLDQIVDTISVLPDEVFAPNSRFDIYSVLLDALGPWTGPLHRRAVMAEAARVTGMFESSGSFQCGEDMSAPRGRPISEIETGAFQVSANSLAFDPSLAACLLSHAGAVDAPTFISAMKSDHGLAVEYFCRLVRFRVDWDGPIIRGEVAAAVSRAAVVEFEGLLIQ